MKRKREKGYWEKRKERFQSGKEAKSRAGYLRLLEHTAHVIVEKNEAHYEVQFSIAKWYVEAMKNANVSL